MTHPEFESSSEEVLRLEDAVTQRPWISQASSYVDGLRSDGRRHPAKQGARRSIVVTMFSRRWQLKVLQVLKSFEPVLRKESVPVPVERICPERCTLWTARPVLWSVVCAIMGLRFGDVDFLVALESFSSEAAIALGMAILRDGLHCRQ